MEGLASRSMDESPSLRISLGSKELGTSCGRGGVLFPASHLPLNVGFQSRALDMRDRKSRASAVVSLGAGKPHMWVLCPAPERPF